jgi:hypothetical protein
MEKKIIKKVSPKDADESTIDSEKRLREVVARLYLNGNDNRSQKNGHNDTLINQLLKPHHIITCGLYENLSLEHRNYINDKEKRRSGTDLKMIQSIAKFILDKHKENNKNHFIRITDTGKQVIEEILEANEFTGKRMKNIFKVESIFQYQERQKVTPGKAR